MLTVNETRALNVVKALAEVDQVAVCSYSDLAMILNISKGYAQMLLRNLQRHGRLQQVPTIGTTAAYRVLPEPAFDPVDVERFWSNIARSEAGCWLWTGAVTAGPNGGYGRFKVDGRGGKKWLAHRYAYALTYPDLNSLPTLDHTCHNADLGCAGGPTCVHRRCCRPDHLVPRTRKDNTNASSNTNAAKTHCKQGHAFDGVNNRGQRTCSTCIRERAARNHRRRRVEKGLPVYNKPGAPSPKNRIDPSTIR